MPEDESTPRPADIAAIHNQLDATAELPVDPAASTYLGEAEAVAADAVAAIHDGHVDVAITRTEQVATLLDHIDTTGNDDADRHVEAAIQLAAAVLETTRDGDNE